MYEKIDNGYPLWHQYDFCESMGNAWRDANFVINFLLLVETIMYHCVVYCAGAEPVARRMREGNNEAIDFAGEPAVARLYELANLAAFLCSDYADYINGESVTIDGGLSWNQPSFEWENL